MVGKDSRVRPISKETDTEKPNPNDCLSSMMQPCLKSPRSFQLEKPILSSPLLFFFFKLLLIGFLSCIRRFMTSMDSYQYSWQHRVYQPSF